MFKDLSIRNFRGIKKSDIEGFEQINLFFGKNNCGKSSLLEAIFLIAGQSNASLPVTINNFRNYARFAENDLNINFYKRNTQNKIHISAHEPRHRELEISILELEKNEISLKGLNNNNSDATSNLYGLKSKFRLDEKVYEATVTLDANDPEHIATVKKDPAYTENLYARYLPPAYMIQPLVDMFSPIIENKQERYLVNILQTIEPGIQDLQLAGKELMVDVGLPQRLPINFLGDGIRKLLTIILSILSCKNGILLIDEVDNGFHYSAMPNLWKSILETAQESNTQIFVTTHNIDSLKGIAKVLKKEEFASFQNHVASFKIIKTQEDTVEAVKYDYEQFDYAIQQEMEIR